MSSDARQNRSYKNLSTSLGFEGSMWDTDKGGLPRSDVPQCLVRCVDAGTGSQRFCQHVPLLRMIIARVLNLLSFESRHASQNRLEGIGKKPDDDVKSVREWENRQPEGVPCISSSSSTCYVSVISSL